MRLHWTRVIWERTAGVSLAILAASVLVLACEAPIDEVPVETGVTEVAVEDNRFGPRAIEVEPGTEVTWEFRGGSDHNVVGDGWGSPVQDDGTFAYRFDEPGTYDYRCTLHGGMTGRVVVAVTAS